jgi:flavonol synthase
MADETPVVDLAAALGGQADGGYQPVAVWDHVSRRVDDYLDDYGRPEQIAAWREGKPYVAALSETAAGD